MKLESHDSLITDGAQQAKKSPPATPAFKKRHRGCSYCILDLDNAPLPVFPPNEVVVALRKVAMDVIEGNRMLLDIHYCQHVYRGDGCVKYDCMELRDDNDVKKIFFLF